MKRVMTVVAGSVAVAAGLAITSAGSADGEVGKPIVLRPIGVVKSTAGRTELVVEKAYQDGLLGLDQWSHIQVLWWFDRNDTPQKRAMLRVHPRADAKNPLTGVFACRAPVRPNLIGLSLCKVLAVQENVITLETIDALDGTPVLDIKPFAPGVDTASGVRVPEWAGPRGSEKGK